MFTRNLFLPSSGSHDISAFVLVSPLKCVNLIFSYRFYFLPFSLSVFILLSLYVLFFMLFFSYFSFLLSSSIIFFISFRNLFIILGLYFYLRHPFLCFVIHLLLLPHSLSFDFGNGPENESRLEGFNFQNADKYGRIERNLNLRLQHSKLLHLFLFACHTSMPQPVCHTILIVHYVSPLF